jgi:hypothetical protein
MTSLDRPSSASRTILARTTSQYGDVYFRAIASRARRSSGERLIAYGLFLGIRAYITSNASLSGCEPTTSWGSLAAQRSQRR